MTYSIISLLLGLSFFTTAILGTLLIAKCREVSGKFLGLTAYGAMIWVFANILVKVTIDLDMFSVRLMYITGAMTLASFVFFAYTFKGPSLRENPPLFFGILFSSTLLLILIIFSDLILAGVNIIDKARNIEILFGPLLFLYILYIVLFCSIGMQYIVRKVKIIEDKIGKKQLVMIGIITSLAIITGFILDIILPLFGNFKYLLYGPISISAFVIIASYIILRHQVYQIKILTTELLVMPILLIVYIQIFMSESPDIFFWRSTVFLLILFFSVFLLRNINRVVKQREQIERLNERMSNFVSFTTHELRTPISKFKNGLKMILDGEYGELPTPARDLSQRLLDVTRDMGLDVETFLNLNKLEIGKLSLNIQKFNLNHLADKVIKDFTDKAHEKIIEISFQPFANLPDVEADNFKIRHVMNNLLSNAIKYTPTGGQIEIKIKPDKEKQNIIFAVKDTGIGIPEDIINELFSLYERGAQQAKIVAGGSGIGLYLSKKLIELHDGKIWVESDGVDQGSKFSFSLPIKRFGS